MKIQPRIRNRTFINFCFANIANKISAFLEKSNVPLLRNFKIHPFGSQYYSLIKVIFIARRRDSISSLNAISRTASKERLKCSNCCWSSDGTVRLQIPDNRSIFEVKYTSVTNASTSLSPNKAIKWFKESTIRVKFGFFLSVMFSCRLRFLSVLRVGIPALESCELL